MFEKVHSTQADELLSNIDLAVAYIGRATCPFCRKFAKKLSGLTNKINTTIYYVDSANFSDNLVNSFREKYNIVTVPGFIVSKNRGSLRFFNYRRRNNRYVKINNQLI